MIGLHNSMNFYSYLNHASSGVYGRNLPRWDSYRCAVVRLWGGFSVSRLRIARVAWVRMAHEMHEMHAAYHANDNTNTQSLLPKPPYTVLHIDQAFSSSSFHKTSKLFHSAVVARRKLEHCLYSIQRQRAKICEHTFDELHIV
jgi:hypothetical protein